MSSENDEWLVWVMVIALGFYGWHYFSTPLDPEKQPGYQEGYEAGESDGIDGLCQQIKERSQTIYNGVQGEGLCPSN